MTVVPFPDEFQRILISRLDADPIFANYLDALERCLRRDLDTTPLVRWWIANNNRASFQNAELDYRFFLERVQLGPHAWEQERKTRIDGFQEALKKEAKEQQHDSGMSTVVSLWSAAKEAGETYRDFATRQPKYASTPWARDWLALFEKIFGDGEPIDIVAANFNSFFLYRRSGRQASTVRRRF